MRSIELFAGAGGLGIGAGRAGFTPLAIVEWDRWCCDTIRENQRLNVDAVARWPQPIEGDIRPLAFQRHRGSVDLVTGGPPCQPFSLGGKHRAHEDERDLWPQAVRVVRETRPRAFIFENVKGLMRSGFTPYRNYIHLQLQHPGMPKKPGEDWERHLARLERHHTGHPPEYNVLPPELLNAANYGIPQRRERVFFIGFRADLGISWSFPRPTHSLEALLWSQRGAGEYWERHKIARKSRALSPKFLTPMEIPRSAPRARPWRTVRDALNGLPDPERQPSKAAGIANHKFQAGARAYPGHTGSPLDEPAKTLKAGVHGVPGGENMLVRSDGSLRYFTVRESARLQTFPDDYVIQGSWSEAMRQLGNAVPVELARGLAASVALAIAPQQKAA